MTKLDQAWSKPRDVSNAASVFGGRVADLMPAYSDIPDEFRYGHTKWNRLQQDWFFAGLKDTKWSPKEGIDTQAALRHLSAIQSSWEPKHEHKEAAVAYLASLWFDDVTYRRAK